MARRPIFRKSDTFVVCRRIRLSSTSFIEVGTEVSLETHKLWRLKGWYRRGRIAKAGCEWANAVIGGRYPGSAPNKSKPRIEQNRSWFFVYDGDQELAKLHGRDALEDWMRENGYASI